MDFKNSKLTHGEMLYKIYNTLIYELGELSWSYDVVCVREKAFNSRGSQGEIGIFKVVGVTDCAVWDVLHKEWSELYPVTVKKELTGSGKAEKQDVAKAVLRYFPEAKFENDDESDAAAVGIAYMIQNGIIERLPPEEPDKETTNETVKEMNAHE